MPKYIRLHNGRLSQLAHLSNPVILTHHLCGSAVLCQVAFLRRCLSTSLFLAADVCEAVMQP